MHKKAFLSFKDVYPNKGQVGCMKQKKNKGKEPIYLKLRSAKLSCPPLYFAYIRSRCAIRQAVVNFKCSS